MDKEKDKIEEAGILGVRQYLLCCPRIKPVIYDNDKTQFWDGDINIYKDEEIENKKDNFLGRVPVQVKGRSDTSKDYRISRADAEAYKNDGGCLFFKVLVGENYSTTVLYAFLSSGYLNTLLKQNTQTINIPLQEVPQNPKDFEKQLYTFATNRNSEKVENTSPKEIQELVKGFEGLRGHLKEIKDKDARMELESSLDVIKNLKDERPDEKDTIGWRDKFYYHSRKAIDLAINNIEGHDFAKLQHDLGYYLDYQKQYHLAERYYLKSLDEYRKRSDIVNVATTLNNLGNLHWNLTHYDEAEKEYNKALRIRHKLAKTNREAYIGDVAQTLNNLAVLHRNLTRYDEAEKEYNKALEIRRELAKTNRDAYIGDVAQTLNNLAVLHRNLKRYDEAEKEYQEALEIYRELAKTSRDVYITYVAATLNNLGILHDDLTCYDEAEKEYKEALEIYRELAKTNRDAYIAYAATTLKNLATLHKNLSHYSEAEKEYKEALEIRRELAKANSNAYIADVAGTLYYLALLLKDLSRYDESKKAAEEALDIYKELAMVYPQIWDNWVEKTKQLLEELSE